MDPDSRKPDPNRWSTNKRVKPLGENIFGTPALTAEGSKRVRPGDENSSSAKFVVAGETVSQQRERERSEWLAAQESFLNEARRKLFERGYMTQEEREGLIIQQSRSKGSRT